MGWSLVSTVSGRFWVWSVLPPGLRGPYYRGLQFAAACGGRSKPALILEAWNAANVQDLKRVLTTEKGVSGLCRMTNTEWETLAFGQGVKVDNNPSITKKKWCGWIWNDYRWSGVDFACPLKDSTVSKTVPSNQILKCNTLSAGRVLAL